ncbi:MAG: peptide ABC transporter substrate-binding protein, partial [Pseudomonadota bacterium]
GPNNKLKTTYITRISSPLFLVGASLVADQLRSIYIEGEIEQKEYSLFTAALTKGAYTLTFETTGTAIDDPDIAFYESYACASPRNYPKYCNREVEATIDEQSATVDPVNRKRLVQALDLKLQQEVARAALYQAVNTSCWYPFVKGYVRASNGIYTHNRMEDVWLDK